MISDAADNGRPALVVDMTSSAAVLALTVAAEVAIPGLGRRGGQGRAYSSTLVASTDAWKYLLSMNL